MAPFTKATDARRRGVVKMSSGVGPSSARYSPKWCQIRVPFPGVACAAPTTYARQAQTHMLGYHSAGLIEAIPIPVPQ